MGPIDYSQNIPDPQAAFMAGLQNGVNLQNLQIQRQQQQLAMQQQMQMQADLQRLSSNPNATGSDYAAVMVRYPQLSENLKKGWEVMNADQQAAQLSHSSQVYAAMSSGRPDVAKGLLETRAAALENSGKTAEAAHARQLVQQIDSDPIGARNALGLLLAAAPGGEKVLQGAGQMGDETRKQGLYPSTLAKSEADAAAAGSDATIKGVAAANAPTATVLGNQETAQKIRASELQGQIATLNGQIAAANSETERGRLTLERDKFNVELQKLQQAQGQQAQDSQNATTNALQTVQTIREHPGMTGWNRPGQWSGAMIKNLPTTERNDLERYVDGLKGQLSFQNLMALKAASPAGASGLGALSEGEMRMLSGIAGVLNTDSENFPKQLAQVERFLQKAQATTLARGNLPTTGEAYVMRHPVYGNVTEGQINALMKQFPGSTRQQVLNFLQSTGGK